MQTDFEKEYMTVNECDADEARRMHDEYQNRISYGEDPKEVLNDYGFEPDFFLHSV